MLIDLKKLCPHARPWILLGIQDNWHLFDKYEVNTKERLAACLAQLAHESDGFATTEEYASGRAYEGRRDLGNTTKGDGVRYKGRGLIQLTGRHNYRVYGKALDLDLEGNPELARKFPAALEIALLYWESKGLNALADKGDFKTITRRINGGYNGMADRLNWWEKFKNAL